MHPRAVVSSVIEMGHAGANACEISRVTGIPRRTISDWLNGQVPKFATRRRPTTTFPCRDELLSSANAAAYCYLLGLYLGDGHITERGSSFRLRISLDSRYPDIVASATTAIDQVLRHGGARVHKHRDANMVVIASYSPAWKVLFPQHGPGLKHERDIRLVPWQRALTQEHPQAFLRGLIHSDGCRFIARQRSRGTAYEYPRYNFKNRSTHLIDEFCRHLDLLEIGWTRSNRETVQVARSDDVSRLDVFIGPKR